MKQTKLFGSPDEPLVFESLELKKAETVSMQVEELIKPLCERLLVVGSVRRRKPMIGDCDFVALASDANWARIVPALKKSRVICAGSGLIKVNFPVETGYFQVDFYRATSSTFGIHSVIRTGSADHNMWLAGYAIARGCRLKYSTGLLKEGVAVAGESEESVFSALNLPCPQPEKREIANGKPLWQTA